jgi:hypothetical protein
VRGEPRARDSPTAPRRRGKGTLRAPAISRPTYGALAEGERPLSPNPAGDPYNKLDPARRDNVYGHTSCAKVRGSHPWRDACFEPRGRRSRARSQQRTRRVIEICCRSLHQTGASGDRCPRSRVLVKSRSNSGDEERQTSAKAARQEPRKQAKRRRTAACRDHFLVDRTQEVGGSSPPSSIPLPHRGSERPWFVDLTPVWARHIPVSPFCSASLGKEVACPLRSSS